MDFKPNWRVAFEGARPLVRFLRDFGVAFKVKFGDKRMATLVHEFVEKEEKELRDLTRRMKEMS